ncbi:MAG: glycoside hydrolase family 97 protein [Bacteroidales bacterium]|nr:glycoside hydrolase family 97 protein [Bacteroidales bacterium]
MKAFHCLIFAAILLLGACSPKAPQLPADALVLRSPDTQVELRFAVVDGVPQYSLSRAGEAVVLPSRLGYTLLGRDGLEDGFTLTDSAFNSLDETWEPVWGEERSIRNHYNEMLVKLRQENGAVMHLRFRLYDDGLGFRYEFPMENALTYFKVEEELTEFALAGDHTVWWISGDYDTQEYNYTRSRLSEIPRINAAPRPYNASQTAISPRAVQTALQLKTDSGLYLNIHEARVLDYPTANLVLGEDNRTLRIHLTPDAEGVKGRLQAPCVSPWRTVQVCPSATAVLASRLILNLNDPCVLEDTSWIHPVKYMGVWWEMITGKTHWSYTADFPSVQLGVTDYAKAKPHGHHGANNENVRRYIDFAAENGFDALLIEGWNEGWEDWFGAQKDFVFDFLTPYPDFDLPGLNAYAHQKGIRLIMHHETSSSTVNYERWMEQAYTLMNQYGYDAVKSGYVGNIIPYGEHHYSQPLINHYHRAVVEAARHHIMVNGHEAVRPTGLCRTWPNMIGNESAMGNEFMADINPGHTAILPFTRLQGGPMDFTPGIFEQDMSVTAPGKTGRMRHTICNQLGLYVTFYSPLQMAADLPENYARFMDAFQFIKDVAVDWDKSLYLEAEPGEYIVTARHPNLATLNSGRLSGHSSVYDFVYKDGKPHDVWYVGGICGEKARDVSVKLDFLQPGLKYEATLYADAPDADYATNPQAYTITKRTVDSDTVIDVHMARSGGFAVSLREL